MKKTPYLLSNQKNIKENTKLGLVDSPKLLFKGKDEELIKEEITFNDSFSEMYYFDGHQ